MKQGWQIKAFSEISHSIDDGDWIEKKDQSETGIRLIQTGNIGVGQYRDKAEKAKFISEDTFKRLKCTEIVCGDILVSRLPDPVGRACILPSLPYKCITAVDCSIIKLKDNVIHPSWFVFYTQSQEYFAKVRKECSGTTRDRISRKKLEVITIPVPPLSEQQRIVSLLDAEFAKIDALKANAEKNLQNAKDLFQAALKKELEPKEGWKSMLLGNFAKMKAGDFIKASDIHSDYYEGSFPCYGGNGLRGYVDVPNKEGEYCLIGRQGALCGNIHIANGVFRATEHAVVVEPYFSMPIKLVYYLLSALNLNKYSTGAAQPGLSVKNIAEKAMISIPPEEKHSIIAATLDGLSVRTQTLQANYEKTLSLCDDLKQALLRKAFNGEI